MGLNRKYQIQWPRSNGSYSLHLLNANIWLPSGSFNLRKSSQISQSHSNPSFHSWYHGITILFASPELWVIVHPAEPFIRQLRDGIWKPPPLQAAEYYSEILCYFCFTFCHLGWACLFVFLITKNPKVIFLKPSTPFHTKSETNKPQAEGSSVTCHSQFLSTWEQERCH